MGFRKFMNEKVVTVTGLNVLPEVNVIAVGYSCGGFQLFSLITAQLLVEYQMDRKSPVTHFCYQAIPSGNLEMKSGYVWVCQKVYSESGAGSFPIISLFGARYQYKKPKKQEDDEMEVDKKHMPLHTIDFRKTKLFERVLSTDVPKKSRSVTSEAIESSFVDVCLIPEHGTECSIAFLSISGIV